MTNSKEMLRSQGKVWLSLRWCLPALLGFLAFLLAFPIDRRIPHWFPLNFAEIFTLWFAFITPVTTVLAMVTLIKRTNSTDGLRTKLLMWATIAASLIVNAFVLLGMWASTY